MISTSLRPWLLCAAAALTILSLTGCTCRSDAVAAQASGSQPEDTTTPRPAAPQAERLVLGAVLDFTGALAEHGADAKLGALLALEHINLAGGVFGSPVEMHFADGATDPEVTVAAARLLRMQQGVHGLVGAMGSEATLKVATEVSASFGLPTISPSATAPQLTLVEDGGFLFRTVASDAAQAPVLARLAAREGYRRVGVLFRDDAYGRGLSEAFAAHFDGDVQAVPIDPERLSFLDELRQAASHGGEVLVVLSFPLEAGIFVTEALEHGIFDRFLFADAVRSLDLLEQVGAARLEGMKGTTPAMRSSRDVASTEAFLSNFRQMFDRAPRSGPAPGVYDAVICLALAAEHAGSSDGAAIRDSLQEVCGGDGERHIADAGSIAAALQAARRGQPINYEGAASSVDWNAAGDVTRGLIDIWQYQNGRIASIEQVPFELES